MERRVMGNYHARCGTGEKVEIISKPHLSSFVGKKPRTETKENIYLIAMVSRNPRKIVGFDVAFDKSSQRIQNIVDASPHADFYCTDGYSGYVDVCYSGHHIRNIHDKSNTFTVEGVNADLRHYIPVLARKSRCFCRKLDTLYAVVAVFVAAYNRFGSAKYIFHNKFPAKDCPFSIVDFLYQRN